MRKGYEFKIKQNGQVVVKGFAPYIDYATQEIAHYVEEYEQDGPIDSITITRV